MGFQSTLTAPIAELACRRITRRLMPYLFVLYVIAYLDRVNVGYAALEMTHALNFAPEVYGFGAGIFFLGYFLLEIPGSILVEKWRDRKSTRLNSSHLVISYAVFCLNNKNN